MNRFRTNLLLAVIAFTIVTIAFAAGSSGQECVDYGEHLRWLHRVDLGGEARDVAVLGDWAVVACQENGLALVDVLAPGEASILAMLDTPGLAMGVAVDGRYAYVADGTAGLQVVRITNPGNLRVAAHLPTLEPALDILVRGRYAYLAVQELGVHVVDVKNPGKPVIVATIGTPDRAERLAFAGDLLLVADALAGLQVVDISDPSAPELVSSYETNARDVGFADGVAYVSVSGDLHLVDLTDPLSPQLLSTLTDRGGGSVVVRDGIAHLASRAGVHFIDVRDPVHPVYLWEVRCRGVAHSLTLKDDMILCAGGAGGLQFIEAIGRSPVPWLGEGDTRIWDMQGLAVSEGYLYVVESDDNAIWVFDLADPLNPTLVAGLPLRDEPTSLAASGRVAYVVTRQGLEVLRYTPDYFVERIAELEIEGLPFGIALSGDLACVSNGYFGLHVIDISDPTEPVLAGELELPPGATAIAERKGRVFIHDRAGTGGFHEIDISDPASPRILGSALIPTNGAPSVGLALTDDLAALVAQSSGLYIVDISVPGNPTEVAHVETWGSALRVVLDGDHAYVSSLGIEVFDLSTPSHVARVGGIQWVANYSYGLALAGGVVYCANSTYGLRTAPLQCSSVYDLEVTIDLKPMDDDDHVNCAAGGVVPVAILSESGFEAAAVDHRTVVFGPARAHEVHSNPHGFVRHEQDVDEDGDIDLLFHFNVQECGFACSPAEQVVLVGSTYDGVKIRGTASINPVIPGVYRHREDLDAVASPNPFNPITTIAFELPRQEAVTLRVFDVAGRLVKKLIDGEICNQGRHEAIWRGRDDSGRQCASGTYFYRLEAGAFQETKRMVLIK